MSSLCKRLLVPALAALALAPAAARAEAPVVKAPAGAVRGVAQDGLEIFKGNSLRRAARRTAALEAARRRGQLERRPRRSGLRPVLPAA
ncbi:hypothetical protein [Caulobacter sp. UC70_42]|uniref:hypothetical protein n=1 Tax=Caulobacter sp. UC70_42 TaxID=3374551 RepID=UPI003756E103